MISTCFSFVIAILFAVIDNAEGSTNNSALVIMDIMLLHLVKMVLFYFLSNTSNHAQFTCKILIPS